ncbi:unnamed protein product [Diamesa hyperborea]
MEEDNNNVKYQKLCTEYSKLRAQAKVLKNAVLEEKNKSSVLQETLRIKDQTLRRSEAELDSLNFRNKQLEHRVANLQDDLQVDQKSNRNNKSNKIRDNQFVSNGQSIDPIIAEELQKRIMENAQLASAISDKNNEIDMYTSRIKDLERQLDKHHHDHSDIEKKLRREIEMHSSRNAELESKIIDVNNHLGSEDGLSVTSDSTIPLHINSMSSLTINDDRIAVLEKELNFYRTQYEILKINDVLRMDENLIAHSQPLQSQQNQRKILSSQSSTSTSSSMSNNNHSTFVNGPTSIMNRDQLVYEYFSKRFDELFLEKCKAESKVINFMTECESLKSNLDIMLDELSENKETNRENQRLFKELEEDFVTTRVNYEEQICVLTEQVISLSDQLASR